MSFMALEEPLDSSDFFSLPCWQYAGTFSCSLGAKAAGVTPAAVGVLSFTARRSREGEHRQTDESHSLCCTI